jgi:hypothetical protein
MPIPNEVDATYADQAEIDTIDIQSMERVASGYVVFTGGVTTAQGSPDGTVAVSAGTARMNGSNKTISAGNVSVITGSANPDGTTAAAADSTLARFSIVTVNASSQLGVVHGTPAALSPNNDGSYLAVFPAISSTLIPLAAIFIPPGVATIASAQIQDKRIVGSVDALHDRDHTFQGSTHTGTHAFIATDTTFDAKGDLPVGTGANTAARLAVTTSAGHALVKDSAAATGLAYAPSWHTAWLPTGAISETSPRNGHSSGQNLSALLSGRMNLVAIYLPKDATITSISFVSGTTAAVTPTAQWFALYSSALALLRQTTDDTNTAWGANTVKTLNLSSTYLTTAAGLYYLGVLVVAGTVPSLKGVSPSTATVIDLLPAICGTSDTGLTTTAPNPAAAITGTGSLPYAYVS